MISTYLILAIVLFSGMVYAVKTEKLDLNAAFTGGVTALLIFAGSGWAGLSLMIAFFLIGSAATGWGISLKTELGLEDANKGKRKAEQVVANSGMAAILSLCSLLFPEQQITFLTSVAACFSSATADTASSELGNIYGKRFYQILSLKPGKRGNDGVVSIEGTLFGFAGSIIIALVFLFTSDDLAGAAIVVLAGNLGNLSDSILGATLQRKRYLNNDTVNFLNTFIAAAAAFMFHLALA